MKAARIAAIVVIAYVGLVVVFESLLGVVQPEPESTLVIITTDESGSAHERVVTRLDIDDRLYVAANHWPRAWFRRALSNPEVSVEIDGEGSLRRAVAVSGAEHDEVALAHPLPVPFRIVTGFPPRVFIRLDPR